MSSSGISLEIPDNMQIDKPKFQKMVFIHNALEKGWTVKKIDDSYVFYKKHENLKEIFMEDYLEKFLLTNMKIDYFKDK
jgi:hypothetical protein